MENSPKTSTISGIHAREWIAPAVTTYLIRQLAESNDAQKYLDKLNLYILPVTNPDGYEYSRQSVGKSTSIYRYLLCNIYLSMDLDQYSTLEKEQEAGEGLQLRGGRLEQELWIQIRT